MRCLNCQVGYHDDCTDPVEQDDGVYDCCCTLVVMTPSGPRTSGDSGARYESAGRPPKELDEIVDKISAGRKRAKQIAPIFPGDLCEWAWLRNAGGGPTPMVGCMGNRMQEKGGQNPEWMQGDRHHGPDRSTLNNTPGVNLHRICAQCHSRYHGLSDPFYGDGKDRPEATEHWWPKEDADCWQHDSVTQASDEEMLASEQWWAERVEKRGPYPIPLDENLRPVLR